MCGLRKVGRDNISDRSHTMSQLGPDNALFDALFTYLRFALSYSVILGMRKVGT